MRRLFAIVLLSLAFAASTYATTFYALPSGSGTSCTLGSPCPLKYALSTAGPVESGDTLCLSQGANVAYTGKFISQLSGATVRSCDATGNPVYNWLTAGWAIIDGYGTTTLTEDINSSTCNFDLASTAWYHGLGPFDSTDIVIDVEYIRVYAISGNTVTSCDRGFSGSTATTHSNGATVETAGSPVLLANGDDSIYRDFEVTNNYTNRDHGTAWPGIETDIRGSGVSSGSGADGNKFVNLLISNHIDGGGSAATSTNTEFSGCLFYNNGGHHDGPPEQGFGNGFYGGNASGFFKFYNNISVNNFGFNGQFGDMAGGDFQKNVFANAGSPLGGLRDPTIGNFNVLYHHEETDTSMSVTDSHHFMPYDNTNLSAWFGYGGLLSNLTATGNYFVGGDQVLKFAGNGTNITTVVSFSNNFLYGPDSALYINKLATFAVTAQNNNTYYDASGRSVFSYNGSGVGFASWKSSTGYDAASTETADAMPDTVAVIPNSYRTGQATVVIYGVSEPSSINVNLATTGLINGQTYTIVNAFNPKGSAVGSGTYNSGNTTISVTLNTAAATVVTPVGMAFTPATTCPAFCVLVVIPGAQASGVAAGVSGGIKLGGGVRLQ